MPQPLLTFIHISDTHLYANPHPSLPPTPNPLARAEAVIKHINAQVFPIDFVLHTGDVGDDLPDIEKYREAQGVLKKLSAPLHVIPGNHDNRDWLREVFYPHSNTPYYSFEHKGVEVACLDTSVPNQPHGEISERQLAWLMKICTAPSDKPLVVALHHHLFPLGSLPMDTMTVKTGVTVHQTLLKARARLRCVLFGHVHERLSFIRDGVLYATAPSTWFQLKTWPGQTGSFVIDDVALPGYNIVTLTSDGLTTVRAVSVNPA